MTDGNLKFAQRRSGRSNGALVEGAALMAFNAIADGFLVDVESNVVHSFHGSLLLGLT